MSAGSTGVAIVGMAGRFPGADGVAKFWQNIKDGVESISRFAPEDLEIPMPSSAIDERTSHYVCAKGVLEGVDQFDARFFGYLPREAELMDPQQRIFLEICWEAVEHAGYDPHRYPGAVGVFAGCYIDTYLIANLCSDPAFLARLVDSIQVGSLQTELGNDKDYIATRVAYKLGLRGPAMTLQSACSTSLVAISTACQSLQSYQCDMALAGGVTIVLPQRKGYFYKEGGMLSPDGSCRTFDQNAAGTVFSNGAAVLLLKRVEDAIADGDTIYAVIRGYAVNNDGGNKVSYTAPSVEGQAEVIALALGMADVDARSIGYVEAHGTATPLGDPIEIGGLTTAYRAHTSDCNYCAIGSVKANLGHLDVASGAIGLIKTSLALQEGLLPPSINFSAPNPKIDFPKTPFYINTELKPWPATGGPRRAGVSSFGVGGTNAHVVVEQPPLFDGGTASRAPQLLALSARTEAELAAQCERLAAHLEANPQVPLADVAHTLQVGRVEFEQRRIVVARDGATAVMRLRAAAAAGSSAQLKASRASVVFLFPGQGSQYAGMGAELYAAEPVYRQVIDRVAAALADDGGLGIDLRDYLLWSPERSSRPRAEVDRELSQTRLAQPAIFAVEVATAALLADWGLRPTALLGHSVGELAAAQVAGMVELEVAARLVATRGRLMQSMAPGRMLAVRAAEQRFAALLDADVVVAARNAPELTVVSGPAAAIAGLARRLAENGIEASELVTSHAFHSPSMAPAAADLVAAFAAAPFAASSLPIFSTALGAENTAAAMRGADYWGQQLLRPVLFADAVVAAVTKEPQTIFVEVGPGQSLASLARLVVKPLGAPPVFSCLGPVQAPGSDLDNLIAAAGRCWLHGIRPDWTKFNAGRRQRVALPTYPFTRKRHWVEPHKLALAGARGDADAGTPRDATPTSSAPLVTVAAAANENESEVETLVKAQLSLIAKQIELLGAG